MGTLPGYWMVWFNEEVIENIPSMAKNTKKYPVSYGSEASNIFIIHKADKKIVFKRSLYGLYFHDAKDWDILMVATTTGNSEGYTYCKFSAATETQEGMDMVGNPSSMEYINMIRSGMIQKVLSPPKRSETLTQFLVPTLHPSKAKLSRKLLIQ